MNIYWVKSHIVLRIILSTLLKQCLQLLFSIFFFPLNCALQWNPWIHSSRLSVYGIQSSKTDSGGEICWTSSRHAPAAVPQVRGHSQLGRMELSQLLPLSLDYSRMPTGNPASSVSRLVLPGEAAERYPGLPSFPLEGWEEQDAKGGLTPDPREQNGRGDWRTGREWGSRRKPSLIT